MAVNRGQFKEAIKAEGNKMGWGRKKPACKHKWVKGSGIKKGKRQ